VFLEKPMSEERTGQVAAPEQDEAVFSRAELQIEREKIQIERERLALERERLAAERERWKTDAEQRSHAEGWRIRTSTLALVAAICLLAGVIAGFVLQRPRGTPPAGIGIEGFAAAQGGTNNAAGAGKTLQLRPVNAGGGKAYLLIIE
jgi:anti-sigma-K factor RskA